MGGDTLWAPRTKMPKSKRKSVESYLDSTDVVSYCILCSDGYFKKYTVRGSGCVLRRIDWKTKVLFFKKRGKTQIRPCEMAHKKVLSGFLNDGRGLII